MRQFQWPVRVYYQDTDAGGVVYHANYLAFYERARTELLRTCNYHQQILLEKKIAFVVRKVTVDYKRPARLDDELNIFTEIVASTATRLTFNQTIINAAQQVINNAEVLVVCVDTELMKPIALPESIVMELTQ